MSCLLTMLPGWAAGLPGKDNGKSGKITGPSVSSAREAVEAAPTDKPESAAVAAVSLADTVATYKADRNEMTWEAVVQSLKTLFSEAETQKMPPPALIQAQPALAALGVKFADSAAARVWLFPQITDSHGVFIQWHELKAAPVPPGRRRNRHRHPGPPVSVYRFQYLSLPVNNYVRDVRVIDTPGGRFLILAGKIKQSMWLGSYKFTGGIWRESAEPLSWIPPFLLNNLSGTMGFSGSDVILTISQPGARTSGSEDAGNCKLALRLVDGRYALEGKATADTPFNAVYQFLQAVQQGRLDLAKAWLSEPSLVSIARYTGLSTHNLNSSYRIVNMSGPPAGTFRYRLVTFDRDDLIFDVSKPKVQWAIKAIFVAPADPVWQKIAKTLPSMTPEPKVDEPASGQAGRDLEPSKEAGHKVSPSRSMK